ncbi:unnamed protein product [Protopolystoma xenopodis]|uniref:Uncharacterized protein n=1 Tax=Protopolystoma xenopodis TaxID=117903 RepID=A0A3S5A3R7_9PLAT|nr:unnamed protein product [Protopolystoma xenopodis]
MDSRLGLDPRSAVTFEPLLPARKREAINRLGLPHVGAATHNKVVLRFSVPEDVFWDAEAAHLECPDSRLHILNLHRYGKPGVLCAHLWGGGGLNPYGMTDEDVIGQILDILGGMYPRALSCKAKIASVSPDAETDTSAQTNAINYQDRNIEGNEVNTSKSVAPEVVNHTSTLGRHRLPKPLAYLVTRWSEDPFALGAYTTGEPGSSDLDRLAYASSLPVPEERGPVVRNSSSICGTNQAAFEDNIPTLDDTGNGIYKAKLSQNSCLSGSVESFAEGKLTLHTDVSHTSFISSRSPQQSGAALSDNSRFPGATSFADTISGQLPSDPEPKHPSQASSLELGFDLEQPLSQPVDSNGHAILAETVITFDEQQISVKDLQPACPQLSESTFSEDTGSSTSSENHASAFSTNDGSNELVTQADVASLESNKLSAPLLQSALAVSTVKSTKAEIQLISAIHETSPVTQDLLVDPVSSLSFSAMEVSPSAKSFVGPLSTCSSATDKCSTGSAVSLSLSETTTLLPTDASLASPSSGAMVEENTEVVLLTDATALEHSQNLGRISSVASCPPSDSSAVLVSRPFETSYQTSQITNNIEMTQLLPNSVNQKFAKLMSSGLASSSVVEVFFTRPSESSENSQLPASSVTVKLEPADISMDLCISGQETRPDEDLKPTSDLIDTGKDETYTEDPSVSQLPSKAFLSSDTQINASPSPPPTVTLSGWADESPPPPAIAIASREYEMRLEPPRLLFAGEGTLTASEAKVIGVTTTTIFS